VDWEKLEREVTESAKRYVTGLIEKGIGRSPAGRLRNFGAMGDDKLRAIAAQAVRENNDPEAMRHIHAELQSRVYVKPHMHAGHPVRGSWREDAHGFNQAMRTTPFKKHSPAEHVALLSETRAVYGKGPHGERGRSLDWHGPELPLADDEDFHRMAHVLAAKGEYNDFDPGKVSKLLASLADTGHINGYRPGRESSVAIYLHVTPGTDMRALSAELKKVHAQEIGPVDAQMRRNMTSGPGAGGPSLPKETGEGTWMRAWWD